MKKLAVMLVVCMCYSPFVFADSASSPVFSSSAIVNGDLEIQVGLNQNSTTGPTVSNMNFGTLNNDLGTGSLRSTTTGSTGTGSVAVRLSGNSSGVPYTITQTGTAPTNGGNIILAGACTVVPIYSSADNAGLGLVGSMGAAGTWVATNKMLYTSDSAGSFRTIQCQYAITDNPAAGATASVPLNQPPGTYNASITFTITS